MAKSYDFIHNESEKALFVSNGLRKYVEYRNLGIENASKGHFVANVIGAREGQNATEFWRRHACSLQMIHLLKGWAKFEYDGHGVHVRHPGDCVLQPPNVRHREIEHSADFEVL